MIKRNIVDAIIEDTEGFPIISVNGPRQSGKTTLIKEEFGYLPYYNLENPDTRSLVESDIRLFFKSNPKGAVIDEIQNIPDLFSYLQVFSDENPEAKFVISGSQNYLLINKIGQSLAGRVAVFTLLPLSFNELTSHSKEYAEFTSSTFIFKGFYPRLYNAKLSSRLFYSSYIQTYLDRDVSSQISSRYSYQFNTFIKLVANRVGQLMNYSSISNQLGISVNTVKTWLSLLESAYVVFPLAPFYKNCNKRLIGSAKYYFYDVGLLSHLLGIQSHDALIHHPFYGGIFENFIIAEAKKSAINSSTQLYFWRESNGSEIDLIIDLGIEQRFIEIKSTHTFSKSLIKGLKNFQKVSNTKSDNCYLVSQIEQEQEVQEGKILHWKSFFRLLA